MTPLFPPVPAVLIPVQSTDMGFPIGRIFCVGRNYEAHAKEMGNEVDRETPWYFTKSASNAALSGASLPFPKGTANYHHEVELAVVLGADAAVYGYCAALDMTRRDLQAVAKDTRRPWCTGKDVEGGAIFGDIQTDFIPQDQRIALTVNDDIRQDAALGELVWSIDEILSHLNTLYTLRAGDVILTGTPAGVGPVTAGDQIIGTIDELPPVRLYLSSG